jgi:hypothetical protein
MSFGLPAIALAQARRAGLRAEKVRVEKELINTLIFKLD